MERLTDQLTTTDAKLWADEFMNVKARLGEQEFDHAMMLSWFANAIMQGYDEGQRRAKANAQATVEALQAQLEQEREKVKGLHEITKVICTHCCEPMEIPSKAVLQTQLTQLQALVRIYKEAVDYYAQTAICARAVDAIEKAATLARRRGSEMAKITQISTVATSGDTDTLYALDENGCLFVGWQERDKEKGGWVWVWKPVPPP